MAARTVLRVATYNVHSYVGRDGRRDPARTSRVIAELDADLIALQEFTYPVEVALDTRSPVVLTALDGYECALGPARQSTANCFGNAILTRYPLVDVHRIDLSIERREPRSALAATIEVDGQTVHVLAAHLGLRVPERRFQIGQIVRYLDSVAHSRLIVLGDFNDWFPGRSVADVLDDRLGRPTMPKSFPSSWPLLALDRIWVQPPGALVAIHAHRTATSRRASDHVPVVAEVAF
jgi:endonuclease/exonuclease/phosphatase family metal-dependent hydrolase